MKKILSLLVPILLATTAQAADWRAIDVGDYQVTVVDMSTAVQDGNVTNAWWTVVNIDPSLPYDTCAMSEDFNCRTNRSRVVQYSFYRDGKRLRVEEGDSQWRAVTPGSLGGGVMDVVCKRKGAPRVEYLNGIAYPGHLSKTLVPFLKQMASERQR